jgi:hypothetical protein
MPWSEGLRRVEPGRAEGATCGQGLDARRTRGSESGGAGPQSGTRCDYVVHEKHRARDRHPGGEDTEQVPAPLLTRQAGLIGSHSDTPEQGEDGQTEFPADPPGQLLGMVESSPLPVGRSARGPRDDLRRRTRPAGEIDEAVDQRSSEGLHPPQLQAEDKLASRPFMHPHGPHRLDPRHGYRMGGAHPLEAGTTGDRARPPTPDTPHSRQPRHRRHSEKASGPLRHEA